MNKTKKWVAAFAIWCSFAGAVQAAPVSLGTGTLNTTNDLTLVQDGETIYEFLDLSATLGWTIADAVSAYSGQGFRWANGGEVATLLEAFSLDYGTTPEDIYRVPDGDFRQFVLVSYLGLAPGSSSSLGWVNDLFSEEFHTYVCLRCGGGTFVSNRSGFYDPHPSIGTFLVRDNLSEVPEPGTLALLAGALVLLISSHKRKG